MDRNLAAVGRLWKASFEKHSTLSVIHKLRLTIWDLHHEAFWESLVTRLPYKMVTRSIKEKQIIDQAIDSLDLPSLWAVVKALCSETFKVWLYGLLVLKPIYAQGKSKLI